MKKYRVSVAIKTIQYVDYELEAESLEQVKELVYDGSIEDYATPVEETLPEIIEREVGHITKMEK